MKKLPWHCFCFLVILALLGTIGLQFYGNIPFSSLSYTNSIAAFLLFIAWLYALCKITVSQIWKIIENYLNPCFLFLLCFFGSMAAGVQLDQTGAVNFSNWFSYFSVLFSSAAAAPVLASAMHILHNTEQCLMQASWHYPPEENFF